MSISISTIYKATTAQALGGLTGILAKARDHVNAAGAAEDDYLQSRIIEDMHPMIWQAQMISEFAVRGGARLSGKQTEDMVDIPFEESSFDDLIARVQTCLAMVMAYDDAVLDGAGDTEITMPIGPDQELTLTGQSYLLSFYLPNLFFHVTTAYDLLRGKGVEIGKRDFLNFGG
ncbi:DUF1993 domain-containing protein [Sphingorhabdus sp. Alg239-R122]|uniref:DUF1993 domain-containing protein n=1 Tax=Sphingorhabdus sp. Alg239-R122 TaxID=2305989 RepID=UPI0013D95AF0|nr:DUF1993 domain-containing protein [Sphingorhabdus sp. Alg239-R122]